MIYEKKKYIKTADFESNLRHLIKEINDTNHITKTGILKLLDAFKNGCIEYEEPQFEIIKELAV